MKKKILSLNFIIIFITSFTLFFFVALYNEFIITKLIRAYEERTIVDLEEKVKLFHKALLLIEKNMAEKGREAILRIYQQLKDEDVSKLAPHQLKEIALENGVDEVYFIDKTGRIFNTSFRPDLNFNLFSLSQDFKDFLLSIFASGRVFTQRIDSSTNTGRLNMYIYYGPEDKDYIMEISIDVERFIKTRYSPHFYNYLFGSFFKPAPDSKKYIKYVNIFHVSELKAIALNNPARVSDKTSLFFERLRRGETIRRKEGDLIKVYKRIGIDEEGFSWVTGKYVEACFDFSFIKAYRKRMIIFSFFIFIGLVVVFFFVFSKLTEKYFLEKFLEINNAINQIAGGDYTYRIAVEGDDEMSRIARNINKMAQAIMESNEKLKHYSRSLEEKVKERTRDLENKNRMLERIKEKLELLSRTDPLTGLLNRRAAIERMEQEKIRFERSRRPFSIVLMDIDNFKRFNDEFGHDCGDFILKEVAEFIRSNIRKQDALARWGGEEFLLILPETSGEGAIVLAEKLREALSRTSFVYGGAEHSVKMTFGISVYDNVEKSIDLCLREADQALYAGKRGGKNKVVAYWHIHKGQEKRDSG